MTAPLYLAIFQLLIFYILFWSHAKIDRISVPTVIKPHAGILTKITQFVRIRFFNIFVISCDSTSSDLQVDFVRLQCVSGYFAYGLTNDCTT